MMNFWRAFAGFNLFMGGFWFAHSVFGMVAISLSGAAMCWYVQKPFKRSAPGLGLRERLAENSRMERF